MSAEQQVAQHYTHGSLERAILDAVRAAGKDPDRLSLDDLAPVDEFHIGGRQATVDLVIQLPFAADQHWLDVGCGLGGASRYIAKTCGCRISGIDLTEEYVHVATMLSRRVGLQDRVRYTQASALALPFAAATFDGAYMLHVGMNIADKTRLFAEVRRVLKPSAPYAIYDVMREAGGEFAYPVPWAAGPETNFIDFADAYQRLLKAARFEIAAVRSRRAFAIDFFRAMRARMAQSGPSPLGLQIVMGTTAPQKIANMIALLERGIIAPTEIIARAA